jgi:RimJ/RimL family protein N-acetyltransferase
MPLEIETKRTILRLINEEHIDQVAELNSDPEVRKFFPDGTQTKAQTRQRIKEFMSFFEKHGLPCFVIFDRLSNEFIGRCGFGPIETGEIEVGYLIARKFWGKGYASEALKALLNWSKSHINADYIIAFAPLGHTASHRVMEKCGMEYYKEGLGHGVECKYYRIKNS